ncbi:MAG: asparagine synthetase B [Deltaproteobacteria bacterium]|nr:asparagine synthetase B [Deltaproteobacteria bacterium]
MGTICGHFVSRGTRASTDIYDMLKKMEHRGPDAHGIYLDGKISTSEESLDLLKGDLSKESRIALGHSTLSIVENKQNVQPYVSCDGILAFIQNGEIYNHDELGTLLLHHHHLSSQSSREILVHLLEETYRGNLLEAVKKVIGILDGMYAIAVTDGKSIVVARDPVGKKPVYYITSNGATYFASEKKALWNGKDDPKRLNPGDILLIDETGVHVHEGYHLQLPQIDVVDFREAIELYKEALTGAIKKRVASLRESRIGVIFSGGIDSVLVSKLLSREGKNTVCYCTGTEDSGDILAAQSVAKELGLELKTTIIDEDIVENILPDIIRDVEEIGLLQVEVAIPMYLAARLAATDDVRVMFTGQGADELFAGYPWYNDVLTQYGYLRLHEKLWEDLNLAYADTLEREDKLTMAHSIELRAPYLDRDVIHTGMRISPRLKIDGADDLLRKRVHRQAAVELGVPPSLAFRLKAPAQSGSGIHSIVENIARKHTNRVDPALVKENIRRDKGSIYRYGNGDYGKELTRFYLQNIQESIKRKYIPEFLTVS